MIDKLSALFNDGKSINQISYNERVLQSQTMKSTSGKVKNLDNSPNQTIENIKPPKPSKKRLPVVKGMEVINGHFDSRYSKMRAGEEEKFLQMAINDYSNRMHSEEPSHNKMYK